MGGVYGIGNFMLFVEFNIFVDLEVVCVVFIFGVLLVMMGFDFIN